MRDKWDKVIVRVNNQGIVVDPLESVDTVFVCKVVRVRVDLISVEPHAPKGKGQEPLTHCLLYKLVILKGTFSDKAVVSHHVHMVHTEILVVAEKLTQEWWDMMYHTTIVRLSCSLCFFGTGTKYGCSDSTRYKSSMSSRRYQRKAREPVGVSGRTKQSIMAMS